MSLFQKFLADRREKPTRPAGRQNSKYSKKLKKVAKIFHLQVLRFLQSIMSDLDRQIEQLRRCEVIKEAEVKALCSKAREILVEESNVQRVDSPVTVSRS